MTIGIHHLGLTVSDLEEAKDFFVTTLGWKITKEDGAYPSVFVSDGAIMLTLWKTQVEESVGFDRKKNIGLHHFAIRVQDIKELENIFHKIDQSPYAIEFPPQQLGSSPHTHFMCIGPSRLRIEFIHIG